ncbi:MAG: hypothetical protein EX269_11870 [Acidimicrobiales bacterium]|nr:MAG: hypothetical protein EX269_11870 [Acidimicrobiales bacterium]
MGFIIFVLIAMAFIAISAIQHDRITRTWKQAARTLGFRYDTNSSKPTLHGMANGRPVKVWVKRVGKNNHQTHYEVDFPVPIGPHLLVKREGGLSKMKRAVGLTDTQVGDHRFDELFDIRADDPAAATLFLTNERKAAMVTLAQLLPQVQISTKEIHLARRGIETDAQMLVSIVSRMVATAEILDAGPAPQAIDIPTPVEQVELPDNVFELDSLVPSDVPPALPVEFTLPSMADAVPEPQPEPLIEPEPEPVPAPAAELDAMPEPPEPETVAEPEPEPASDPAPAMVSVSISFEQDDVITDLLGSDRLGYEIDQRFDELYLGKQVRWSGTVEKLRPFRTDRDFGNTPGTRVTLLIGSLGDGRLVSQQVKAVVHLPEDADLHRGDPITFDGTLLRIDRYMRDIYVGNAFLWEHQQAG